MTPVLWIGVVLATMKHHVTALLPERCEERETSLKWSLAGKQAAYQKLNNLPGTTQAEEMVYLANMSFRENGSLKPCY